MRVSSSWASKRRRVRAGERGSGGVSWAAVGRVAWRRVEARAVGENGGGLVVVLVLVDEVGLEGLGRYGVRSRYAEVEVEVEAGGFAAADVAAMLTRLTLTGSG